MRMGIMQGRMVGPAEGRIQSFPRDNWAQEFGRAAQAGLDCIEWIYDLHGADVNPIATEAGLESLQSLAETTGVGVFSVCADWFMDFPLIRTSPQELEHRLEVLKWLVGRSQKVGAGRVVLPFVDISQLQSREEMDQVAAALTQVIPMCEQAGVELHLETSLSPAAFSELLAKLPSQLVKVNYDSGNSASMGYDPAAEFAAYGGRIGSIHIKDRILGGGTVPLGQGNTNFRALFKAVAEVGYSGDFILQVARGQAGDEVAWAIQNRQFVLDGFSSNEGAST